ncbi:MAG: hypothetical protein KDK37_16285, partial [Leptospiraceae bacterium]|nr:hypothetical protein [Leptospiraceae bacterium]
FGLIRRGTVGMVIFFAYSGVVIGVVVITLTNQGILPLNLITRHAALIGSTAEMLVLAVLMGVMLRNVQSRRVRSSAEERLAKDIEQKANQYAEKLQTEILEQAALDLRIPLESIRSTVVEVRQTTDLDRRSTEILASMQTLNSNALETLKQETHPFSHPGFQSLALSLETMAAAFKPIRMEIFENNVPADLIASLAPAEWKRLIDSLQSWTTQWGGQLKLQIETDSAARSPVLLVDYRPVGFGKNTYADAQIIRFPVELGQYPVETTDANKTGVDHSIPANLDTGFLYYSAPSALMRALAPVASWKTMENSDNSSIPSAHYFLDLSALRLEDTHRIARLKAWMDGLSQEQPTLLLLADMRIRAEDLELDPDLDTILYRPAAPEQIIEEWQRTADLARRLASQRRSYDLTRQRSEARLRRTLARDLGNQLRELQDLAGGSDSGKNHRAIVDRVQNANRSLRDILHSLPE